MINKLKMIKTAFKHLSADSFKDRNSFEDSLNQFLADVGLPAVHLEEGQESNQSLPAFNTLDFDEISNHFNDNS